MKLTTLSKQAHLLKRYLKHRRDIDLMFLITPYTTYTFSMHSERSNLKFQEE
jgi:hypothetical protein